MLLMLLKSAFVTQSGYIFILIFYLNVNIVVSNLSHRGRKQYYIKILKIKSQTQQSRVKIKFHFIMVKVSHNNVGVVIRVSVLKVTSTIVLVGLRTFTTGGGMHGLFKCVCRFGANPEKVFHIR